VRNKVLAGLAVILVVLVVALLAAPAFIDVNRYRPQIQAKLQEQLGRPVSLGEMKLSLIPLSFRVKDAVVAEDPAFSMGRPFVTVGALYVRPALIPLLHQEVQIKSVQLDQPSVELIRNEQGVWNFSTLAHGRQPSGKTTEFSLDHLKLYNGQVGLTDRLEQNPRAVYDHIDLDVADFANEKAFSMNLRAHLPGPGQQDIVLQGTAGPIDHNQPARTPFDGKISLNSVSLSGLQRFVNSEALVSSEAILTGNGELKNDRGTLASTGKFEARNSRIRGVEIGYPITLDYQISADLNQSKATIQRANLTLGQTPVSLKGSIDAQPKPMQVDVTMQASNASIAEAARLAAAFGAAFDAKTIVTGNVNMNVHAQGAVTKPVLNGDMEARNLRVVGGEIREPVQVDDIKLALSPDSIRSNDFTVRTGRTNATAQIAVSDYVSNAPKIQAKLNTDNADIQELLRMAHAYGISAAQGLNGTGTITLNVTANGPLNEPGQMTFDGSGAIHNVSLQLPSASKPIGVRTADVRFSGNGATLDNLDASIGQTAVHGGMTVNNFAAPQVQFTISANVINVPELEQLFKLQPASPPGRPGPNAPTAPSEPTARSGEGLLSRATGSGSFTAGTVIYDELTLNNVQSTVTLDHGIITAKPLTAGLYNGQQSGAVVINTRTTPPTYTVDSKLQGVDANQLLSAVSPLKKTLYGLLSANTDAHFTTAGGAESILGSLNGKASINLKDGKIANVDLLHQLSTIAQFTHAGGTVQPFTQLIQLTGDFDINGGVARTNNLKAAMDAGSLAAAGLIDLAHEKLDLHLTAVLSQQYSQTVGGTGIGGFLNTALANTKGELVIPVLVTGTFRQPIFTPDVEKLAQMKLQNLVPGVENPAGLTNGILGQILRGKPLPNQNQQPQQAQPQQQQPNNLNDLLDLFKKKQQK
jgi:uncharacterized protein involved in outer membrane biogenesis